MTDRKSERLLNLLIMLLVQRRFIGKERIRELLYDGSSGAAFEKMFERDKEELRSLGVPIEVGTLDPLFDDEVGYRIRADRFALADLDFDAEEAAVLALATKVWEHARLADATFEGLRKLKAGGIEVDESALDVLSPRLSAEEPGFEVFWQAALDRTRVAFDYRTGPQAPVTTRHLEPWGVVRASGRWYVVGFDVDRGEERVFRLSRVIGRVRTRGKHGSFDIPAGTDIRSVARRLAPAPSGSPAVVLARTGCGLGLRREAVSVTHDVSGPDTRSGWDRLVLPPGSADTADEVLSYGSDVYVEEPLDLQESVVQRLRAGAELSR